MNPYQKPYLHAAKDRDRRAARERDLAEMVGKTFIYHGPADTDRTSRRLYPDLVGRRCTVLALSSEKGPCPLIVVFEGSYRGISEPEWLRPVERAEVACA